MKYLLILLTIFCLQANAQSTEDKLVDAIDTAAVSRPAEYVYLSIPKATYVAGLTPLIFHAKVVMDGKPSMLSKTLYVTLNNLEGKVIIKQMLPLKEGKVTGSILFPADLPSGKYMIHAYTLWMLNTPEYVFHRQIDFVNSSFYKNTQVIPVSPSALITNVEGGQLIEGVPARISSGILNSTANAKGLRILDNTGQNVARDIVTNGAFITAIFTPQSGKQYIVNVDMPDGKTFTNKLPAVSTEGITISVDNAAPTKTYVKLIRAEKNKSAYNNLLIAGIVNQHVVYLSRLDLDKGQDALAISKKKLPPGILHLIVLDDSLRVLTSRDAFIGDGTDSLNIRLEKGNGLDNILVSSLNGNSYTGTTAILLQPANTTASMPKKDMDLILSGLDNTYRPFLETIATDESARLSSVDALMMLQTSNTTSWNDLINGKFPAIRYPFETGMSITGRLVSPRMSASMKDATIEMIIKMPDTTTLIGQAQILPDGRFALPGLQFNNKATAYYQLKNKGKIILAPEIRIDPVYMDTLSRSFPLLTQRSASNTLLPALNNIEQQFLNEKYRADTSYARLLSEVVVRSRKVSTLDSLNKLYASAFFEQSDQTIAMDDGHYFDIWIYLERNVPGIRIEKTPEGVHANFARYAGMQVFGEDQSPSSIDFFINESPASVDIVDNINLEDIGMIKVFKGANAIALGSNKGAIAIYLKKGKNVRDWREETYQSLIRTGYSAVLNLTDIVQPGISIWKNNFSITPAEKAIIITNASPDAHYFFRFDGTDASGRFIQFFKIL